MHLEDRLQELYFKSKMLSEYLRGQMRVHVKELGVVLGYVHDSFSDFAVSLVMFLKTAFCACFCVLFHIRRCTLPGFSSF